jgi:CheY-like chemotaxis protein
MNTRLKTPILLIEDNPADADLIKIYLKDVGFKFELYHCDTLMEGFDLIETRGIELALLDLTLPDSTGFKTVTTFLEKAPDVPLIVLTGLNNEIIGNQAIKAGAQDFLVKDQIDEKQLGRSIRYALQRFKTQHKLEVTARELAISERRFQEAQELAHFGSWEMDIVTNEMKWSDEMFRILGFSPKSISPSLGDYLNYVHFEDKEVVENFFEASGKDSKQHQLEHKIIVNGKTIKTVSIQAKMFFDEYAEKALLVGALQDISDKKLSQQLMAEKEIAQQEALLKEKTFAELNFHVRTPLNSIGNILYLLEQTRVSPSQMDYLRDLKTSVDDLSIVLNNLFNFALLNSGKLKVQKERTHTIEFLTSLEKFSKLKSEATDIKLSWQIGDSLPTRLEMDQAKFSQVYFNLLEVILKSISHPKELEISIGMVNLNSKPNLSVNFKGAIEPLPDWQDLHSENFRPDEMEDNPLLRKKLSLSIVEKIILTLEGQFSYLPNPKGSPEIHCNIPVQPLLQSRLINGEKPESPLHILLVEDHLLNQISTRKLLTSWSEFVEVDIAENGKIAVEKIQSSNYDLVLMDIQMPVLNGLDATKIIREKDTLLPIIALTANASKHEADQCIEAGMNSYLAKPFRPQELYDKILGIMVEAG